MHRHLARHPDTAFRHNFTKEFSLIQHGFQRQPNLISEPRRWWAMMRGLAALFVHNRRGLASSFYYPILNRPRAEVMRQLSGSGAIHWLFKYWSRPTRTNPNGLLVGDITPFYMNLPAEALKGLIAELEKDFEVKTLVMWRDPLARLNSAMKHVTRDGDASAEKDLRQFCADGTLRGWAFCGHYKMAVRTIKSHLPDTYEMIYEELFGPDGQTHLDHFHAWLGIRPWAGNFEVRVNLPDERSTALTPEELASARKFLQPEYNVMERRLGRARLASIWNL